MQTVSRCQVLQLSLTVAYDCVGGLYCFPASGTKKLKVR